MAEFILEANERQVGKQSELNNIRNNSRVPGVIYGFSQEPIVVDFDYLKLLNTVKSAGTSNIITIKAGSKNIKTIVRAYQQDPVSDRLTHIDLMAVDEKKELTTKVPLEFVGQSRAVREQGGKLNTKTLEVNVRCLPSDLPASIKVDVSVLENLGQKLTIKDLEVSDKVTVMEDPNNPVADVTVPKKLEIIEPIVAKPEGEAGEEGAEAKPEGENKEETKPEAEAKE